MFIIRILMFDRQEPQPFRPKRPDLKKRLLIQAGLLLPLASVCAIEGTPDKKITYIEAETIRNDTHIFDPQTLAFANLVRNDLYGIMREYVPQSLLDRGLYVAGEGDGFSNWAEQIEFFELFNSKVAALPSPIFSLEANMGKSGPKYHAFAWYGRSYSPRDIKMFPVLTRISADLPKTIPANNLKDKMDSTFDLSPFLHWTQTSYIEQSKDSISGPADPNGPNYVILDANGKTRGWKNLFVEIDERGNNRVDVQLGPLPAYVESQFRFI